MVTMLREVFSNVLDAVADATRAVYGERLTGIVVYGSVARETMRRDSDIDLLVVAQPLPEGRLARMDEFEAVERLAAPALGTARTSGVTTRLAPIVRTEAELEQSGFLIFDIACDGVILDDPHGRIESHLANVQANLEHRGARRRSASGATYWVLDPNVRPGDVVNL